MRWVELCKTCWALLTDDLLVGHWSWWLKGEGNMSKMRSEKNELSCTLVFQPKLEFVSDFHFQYCHFSIPVHQLPLKKKKKVVICKPFVFKP